MATRDLDKSARKMRDAAERQERVPGEADAETAEAHPEVTDDKHSKGRPKAPAKR